jgi:SOS-response transcriptional repressor LexA
MQTQKLSCDVVFEYVRDYIAVHSYPPSIRNIARGCQLSVTAVVYNLNKLEAWGWLSREPGVARSLRILKERREKT